MLLPKFSQNDSFVWILQKCAQKEIYDQLRGTWDITLNSLEFPVDLNHLISNSLLHDSGQIVLHFIWKIRLTGIALVTLIFTLLLLF